ncbi:iris-like [Styela clava]
MKLLVLVVCALSALDACYAKSKSNVRAIDDFSMSLREFSGSMLHAIEQKRIDDKADEGGNIFFSANSIAHTLGMIMAGAGGNTHQQIMTALMISSKQKYSSFNINNLFKKIFNKVFNESRVVDIKSLMANALFLQQSYPINTNYTNTLDIFYDTELQWVEFSQNVETATVINGWVNHKTDGFITDIIKPTDLDNMVRLVLVNAIFFKAEWQNEMKPVGDKTFNGTNGEEIVEFIGLGSYEVSYRYERNATKIAIPYKDKSAYLVILLPKDETAMKQYSERQKLINFARDLPNLESWTKTKANFSMPKFEIKQELDLKDLFTSHMGIHDLFSSKADLSGISDVEDLYVSSFTHKARVKVDEEGTIAAAASAVGISARSSGGAQVITIDKPFIFAIYRERQAIFFGKLNRIG